MYPILRLAYQFFVHRNDAPLDLTETHVSHLICLPWDIDPWMELNNGRTLTLYDMGRLPLARRTGLIRLLRQQEWSLTDGRCLGPLSPPRSHVRTGRDAEPGGLLG